MRIAQLAPLVEPVPPVGYGGTELVVSLLTEELVRRGHDVTLFAAGSSRTASKLVSIEENPLRNHVPTHRWDAYNIRLLLRLLQMQDQFDIVHNHMGYVALPLLSELRIPIVTTMHNNIKAYNQDIYFQYGRTPFVAISQAYRRLNNPDKLNFVDVVYNGIDLSLFHVNRSAKRDYLLFLGRLCDDKGTAQAIEIAKRLGHQLLIAGKVDEDDTRYFEERVKPQLYGSIEYIGEVDLEEKARLYSNARAVLYPINFDEPFGLVMAESLAAGTPLLAFDRGSVREVLSDGETAVIGNSVDELVNRFNEIEQITPQACRQRCEQLFSKEAMAHNYLNVYEKLLSEPRSDAAHLPGPRMVSPLHDS